MVRPKKNLVKTENKNIQNAVDVTKTLRSADVAAGLAKIISDAGVKQTPP